MINFAIYALILVSHLFEVAYGLLRWKLQISLALKPKGIVQKSMAG